MTLSGSAWLWLLVPYAALVLLVLRSYRPKVGVPFLDLWPRELSPQRRHHGFRIPPLALWLMLLAILAGILAMARPMKRGESARAIRVSMVVDRGIVMLAGNRLQRARERVLRELPPLLEPDATIEVIDDQGYRQLVGPGGLAKALAGEAGTLDTRDAVNAIVRRLVNESDDPIVLMSEPVAGVPAGRVVVATPSGVVRNVGIVSADAVANRVLLRVRNNSDVKQVRCELEGQEGKGEGHRETTLDLPAWGQEMQYTLECPKGRPLTIRLDVADDLAVDNVFRVPADPSVKLEMSAGVPPAVGRFVERYQRVRPAGADAMVVHVLASSEGGIPPRSVVVLAGEAEGEGSVELSDARVLPEHPLFANVRLPRTVLASRQKPPVLSDGIWRILLADQGRPLLASDEVNRRVWIGFDSKPWARETDYPIFWNNLVAFLSARERLQVNVPSPALMSITAPDQPLLIPSNAVRAVNLAEYCWCAASVLVLGAMLSIAVPKLGR